MVQSAVTLTCSVMDTCFVFGGGNFQGRGVVTNNRNSHIAKIAEKRGGLITGEKS